MFNFHKHMLDNRIQYARLYDPQHRNNNYRKRL
jgi:hypothetical protein